MLVKDANGDVKPPCDQTGNYVINMATGECKQSRCVRVGVIGSTGVGKTSLIEQFVFNSFTLTYKTTRFKRVYCVTAFHNDRYYQLQILDLPYVQHFPSNTVREYTSCNAHAVELLTCDAILLVHDVTSADSFQHITRLRSEIINSPGNMPIVVAANKCDSSTDKHLTRRDVTNYVKKQRWGCPYLETSAKSNWRVTSVFKELIRVIECGETNQKVTTTRAARVQNALRTNHCTIL